MAIETHYNCDLPNNDMFNQQGLGSSAAKFVIKRTLWWGYDGIYTLRYINITMEHAHVWWICPFNMVIFHAFVNVYQRVYPIISLINPYKSYYLPLNPYRPIIIPWCYGSNRFTKQGRLATGRRTMISSSQRARQKGHTSVAAAIHRCSANIYSTNHVATKKKHYIDTHIL